MNTINSRKHIPAPFHTLMLDANSPIIDFYPTSVEVDMNGKKMAWQGLTLLPFIDEKRLLDAMKPFSAKLTEEERQRNIKGKNVLLVSGDNPLYSSIEELYTKGKSNAVSIN
jgi:5'-3' exoribonuclease 2